MANFLNELQTIDASGGPIAGEHNFFRGGPLDIYDKETKAAIAKLSHEFDSNKLLSIWDEALESKWEKTNVWVHGDVAVGNLIINKGKLSAVIDFGILGVGDPACDLVMYYNYFNSDARRVFKDKVNCDEATFKRAKGWALWKALITYLKMNDKISRNTILNIMSD